MVKIAEPDTSGNELKYLKECIETNWVSSAGTFIERFEKKFAGFCGTKYATSCSSGTTALHLALLSLGIKEKEEVIIPNVTFAATANAVRYCNARPVLVDIDKRTLNISPKEIEKKISENTKAIIPVHLFGNPCEIDKILEIAEKNNLKVIEDCAQAHGAEYKGKKVGSFGDIGCFSFFGNKIITTGEGGMCVSNNKELIDKINLIKNHGMTKGKRYWHDIIGHNYRLTNMQAAVGLAQLERIEEFSKKRKKLARLYKELLKNIKEIEFQESSKNSSVVYWMFPILLKNNSKLDISRLAKKLGEYEIDTRGMFYPLNEMPPYLDSQEFPGSRIAIKNGLVLPMHTQLKEDEVKYICKVIKNHLK